MFIVATPEYFDNVANALIHNQVTLPCKASVDTTVRWYYEQYCEHFEHGMHICSNPVLIDTRKQYQIRHDEPGENNLLINAVAKKMFGVYTCKDQSSGHVYYRGLLNVISQYTFLAILSYRAVY